MRPHQGTRKGRLYYDDAACCQSYHGRGKPHPGDDEGPCGRPEAQYSLLNRQRKIEYTALIWLTLKPHMTAVASDDLPGNVESQSHTLNVRSKLWEGSESGDNGRE